MVGYNRVMKIDFYHLDNDEIHVSMDLVLEDGELKFNGYDYGKRVKELRGISDDYEYHLSLDKENTAKLFELLEINEKSDKEKLENIKERFSKDEGFSGFKDFCEENGIKTNFFCWP